MEPADLIRRVRERADFDRAGMVLCHQGVVRATSRDGRPVSGLRVSVDHEGLDALLRRQREREGILDIQIHINEGRDLGVGDTVMVLVVAGDFRENVIAALEETLDAVKTAVTHKTEFFVGGAAERKEREAAT